MHSSLSPNAHAIPPDHKSGEIITHQREELVEAAESGLQEVRNDLRRIMQCALGIPFYERNHITRFKNGSEAFPAMFEAIDGAKHSIDMLQFVLWRSDIAFELLKRLKAAGERGCRVRVLLDGFGSHPIRNQEVQELVGDSATIARFRPLRLTRGLRNANRSHRRMLVIDHQEAFTGGIGFGTQWDAGTDQQPPWRDSHFRLSGPGVDGFFGAFAEHWAESLGQPVRGLERMRKPDPAGSASVQVVRSDTSMKWSDVATAFRTLVSHAASRFWLTTAYFTPDQSTLGLLRRLADRGGDVRILLPGPQVDKQIEWYATQDVLPELKGSGVRVFRYLPTMLHAKTLVVDDDIVAFGSANFNFRSFRQDDEILVSVRDPELHRVMCDDFEDDLRHAEELPMPYQRPRGVRARVSRWMSRRVRAHL